MDNKLVSIIIPVYNAEKYLKDAIESAIAQTWQNKEIIIVDDGSTDLSLVVAQKYENDWIRVFHQPNKGASAARNMGFKQSKGQYIQFFDADDLLSPNKIELQVNALQNAPDKVAVCSTVHYMNGTLHTASSPSAYEDRFLFDTTDPIFFLLNLYGGFSDTGSMVQPNAWLTPKHLIEKAGLWDENLTVDDDGEFFCKVLLASTGVVKTGGYNYYRKFAGKNKNLSSLKYETHLLSQYRSHQLKFEHIAACHSSADLNRWYANGLMQIAFHAYPIYPKLTRKIMAEIAATKITVNFNSLFATVSGRFLSRILGWKTAKKLQFGLQKN